MIDKLGLGVDFEAWVVLYTCTSPVFYKRIGHAIPPESLASEAGMWLVRAAHVIHTETSRACESEVIALQRVKAWCNDGKVRASVIIAAVDLLEITEDAHTVSVDAVVDELIPVLKRAKQQDALKHALDSFASGRGLSDVAVMIEDSESLGKSHRSAGVRLTPEAMAHVSQLRHLDRIPTGVDELDFVISGGIPRGALGVAIGGSGSGKSMFLAQVAATAFASGCFVLYATLELPEAVVLARLASSITNVPLSAVLSGSQEATERLRKLQPRLGLCDVREFTARATTPQEVFRWVDDTSRSEGKPVDLICVDYADKLCAPSQRNDYSEMGTVYEQLRVGVNERQMWGWTASQATRKKGKARLDQDDVADSMHKVRVADLVVTLTVRDHPDGSGDRDVEIFVAKNRHGESRMSVGPLPADYQFGRLVPSAMLASLGYT